MKRVLVISNNCFSKTNSNGRTLGNLFAYYEKDKVAQFYISGDPEYDYCNNYYRVSDEEVLQSVFPFLKKSGKTQTEALHHKKRTVINMIARNIFWNFGAWKNNRMKRWMDGFNPEAIVLQIGDCSFMIKFALWCAKRYKAELFIYNTEGYFFKDFNYFRDGHNILYRFFITDYRKWFKRIVKKSVCSIYLCDQLKNDYDAVFGHRSVVIYNSSSLELPPMIITGYPVFSYIGNLELDRDKTLCIVADALQKIDRSLKIDVYGKASEETIQLFNNHKGINYHGFVDYSVVQQIITKSHFLLHVEGFEDFYIKDTKYGFSGKIADSLASGRVLFAVEPESNACIDYLKRNKCGLIASTFDQLNAVLNQIVRNEIDLKAIIDTQFQLARRNHNLETNSLRFIDVITRGGESHEIY